MTKEMEVLTAWHEHIDQLDELMGRLLDLGEGHVFSDLGKHHLATVGETLRSAANIMDLLGREGEEA